MIFYVNFTIAACVFLTLIAVNAATYLMKKPLLDNEIKDITKTLSDKEIELALSDLSLPDLKYLSKLIDTANAADYDEAADNFLESNQRMQIFNDFPDKNSVDKNDDEDDENEPEAEGFREARNVLQFQIPRESSRSQYTMANLRAKREDSQNNQGNTVDAEYLKLLENSFPHGSEDHEDSENKKEHIRVKRNQKQTMKNKINKKIV